MIYTISGFTALGCYLLATVQLGIRIKRDAYAPAAKRQVLALGACALCLNGVFLADLVLVRDGLNLGFSNAWGLISWMIACSIALVAVRKPVEKFLIIFFPLAGLGIVLAMLLPSQRILADSASIGLKIHILLSISAYALLTIAAFQAVLLAIQDHQLCHKHPTSIMGVLPPLQVMEDLLVKLIAIGCILLSIGLLTGFAFVHDLLAQHLAHKAILSLLSWCVFVILLWGRRWRGWRGHTLARWTIGGFCALMLAFFGSKLVLEMILMRV